MVLRELLAEPPPPLPNFQALLGYVTRLSGLPGAWILEVLRGEEDAGRHSLLAWLSWYEDMDMGCSSATTIQLANSPFQTFPFPPAPPPTWGSAPKWLLRARQEAELGKSSSL